MVVQRGEQVPDEVGAGAPGCGEPKLDDCGGAGLGCIGGEGPFERRQLDAGQRVQGVGELAVCGLGELRELDETDVVADDEGRFDAAQGNHVAHDLHLHRLPDALPSERETHFRAARPPQPPDDPLLRNPLSGYQRVVDAQDAVAHRGQQLALGNLLGCEVGSGNG